MNTNTPSKEPVKGDNDATSCGASSVFNFSAGALAVIAAISIGYVIYSYFFGGS